MQEDFISEFRFDPDSVDMQESNLDHFHYFYFVLYRNEWYVGEACTLKALQDRLQKRASVFGILRESFGFVYYIQLEVPKFQTPYTCEQGLRDLISGYLETYAPKSYALFCTNKKACAKTSFSDSFNTHAIIGTEGQYKGKTLKNYITQELISSDRYVNFIAPEPQVIEYGKCSLPSIFR